MGLEVAIESVQHLGQSLVPARTIDLRLIGQVGGHVTVQAEHGVVGGVVCGVFNP